MNKKKLPLYFPPPIVTYLHHAIPLSIILSVNHTEGWFLSNYLKLFFCKKQNKIDFYPNSIHYKRSLFLDLHILNEDIMNLNNIIVKIINWINNGYYVECLVSESEIPGTFNYNKAPILHQAFFYGYDIICHCLKMVNFNSNNSFSLINVDFDVFAKAFYSKTTKKMIDLTSDWADGAKGYDHRVVLYKPLNNTRYKFNCDNVIHGLEKYISRENVSSSNSKTGDINIYDEIIDYISELKHCKIKNIDIRIFQCVWEHKKIMLHRLYYIKNIQRNFSSNLNNYNEVIKSTNTIRLLALKYFLSQDCYLLDKIITLLKKTKITEIKILTNYINAYKNI